MTVPFIDTNVLIRYITQDNAPQALGAAALIEQLESGALVATTCEAVFVEAVHVLSSRTLYGLPRPLVADYLTRFVRLRGLRLANKRVYIRALALYAVTSLDFADALIVAHMERRGAPWVYSFDRDFDRVEGVTRREP